MKKTKATFPIASLVKILILVVAIAVAYFFYTKSTPSPTTTKRPAVHFKEPSEQEGLLFEEKNAKAKCLTQYTLTQDLPIYAKRIYPDKKEYLVLKPLQPEDAPTVYEAMKNNIPVQLWNPFAYQFYGTSLADTRQVIVSEQLRMLREPAYMRLGIFLKKDDQAHFIGCVSMSPSSSQHPRTKGGTMVNVAFSRCDANHLTSKFGYQPKGFMRLSTKILINHAIDVGVATDFILVVHHKNFSSKRLIKSLKVGKRIDPKTIQPWNYKHKQNECEVYHFTAQQWKKKHGKRSKPIAK